MGLAAGVSKAGEKGAATRGEGRKSEDQGGAEEGEVREEECSPVQYEGKQCPGPARNGGLQVSLFPFCDISRMFYYQIKIKKSDFDNTLHCRASDDNPIPVFLSRCIEFIETEGLLVEGLYRVPGNRAHVDLLFQHFDEDPNFDINSLDIAVNAVATAVKVSSIQHHQLIDDKVTPYDHRHNGITCQGPF